MTAAKSATARYEAAERRGDDTHWWKAYQLHSEAALAAKAHGKLQLTGIASLSPADRKPFRPTETEIHRAANKVLGSLEPRSTQAGPKTS